MHDIYEELYQLCETIEKDLAKTNEKLRMTGGEMSGSDLEYVDKLTHTLKSIKATMAMVEDEGEEGYSRRGGSYYREGGQDGRGGGNSSYRGGQGGRGGSSSYYREGGGQGGGSSYARGRGRNARRDSMGRYARAGGYSREEGKEDMIEQLREIMEDAPDQQSQQEIQRLISKMEQM